MSPIRLYNNLLHLLFYVFLTFVIHHATSGSTHANILCLESERDALLQFKHGIRVDHCGSLHSWRVGQDCCLWDGVECEDQSGHMIRLYVLRNGISYYDGNQYYKPCLEVVGWDADDHDQESKDRIQAFLNTPAVERHWPTSFARDIITSFVPTTDIVPVNRIAAPRIAQNVVARVPANAAPRVPAVNLPVTGSSSSVATRTRRNLGPTMDRIRAARNAAGNRASTPVIIIDPAPSPSGVPARNVSDVPESSATVSEPEIPAPPKRRRVGLEFLLPDPVITSRAVDDGAELLRSFGTELSERMPDIPIGNLAKFLVADVRDAMYGTLLLGNRVQDLQNAVDAHARIVADKDAAIRNLETVLNRELATSRELTQQLSALEAVVGDLRRQEVEHLGRISELSATVKELEDAELNVALYWTTVGRIEVLRGSGGPTSLERELSNFQRLFPGQALPDSEAESSLREEGQDAGANNVEARNPGAGEDPPVQSAES